MLLVARQLAVEPGEHDVESLVEFGGSVVGGQFGGEAAEQRKLPWWQAVEAEAQQVVLLVGVDDMRLGRSPNGVKIGRVTMRPIT